MGLEQELAKYNPSESWNQSGYLANKINNYWDRDLRKYLHCMNIINQISVCHCVTIFQIKGPQFSNYK